MMATVPLIIRSANACRGKEGLNINSVLLIRVNSILIRTKFINYEEGSNVPLVDLQSTAYNSATPHICNNLYLYYISWYHSIRIFLSSRSFRTIEELSKR